jgi:hypothetical protein
VLIPFVKMFLLFDLVAEFDSVISLLLYEFVNEDKECEGVFLSS